MKKVRVAESIPANSFKRVLLIAFHYPPCHIGSGHLRTLAFSRHLRNYGWEPIVLTATEPSYYQTSAELVEKIPKEIVVSRARAIDSREVFSIRGRYPGFLAEPDRWSSWWFAGVVKGLNLVRKLQPDIIWSTYPISTAHLIAGSIQKLTKLPWVADFRDPMGGDLSTGAPELSAANQWVESFTCNNSCAATFTTSRAATYYARKYPKKSPNTWSVVENGYDEEDFAFLSDSGVPITGKKTGPIKFLHTGTLYSRGRDPVSLLLAVAALKDKEIISSANFRLILRGTGNDKGYSETVSRMNVDDIVSVYPTISHKDSIKEAFDCDVSIIMQGEEFDRQIPAKAYEALRIGRSILGLVGENGETRRLLEAEGVKHLCGISDVSAIMSQLEGLLTDSRVNSKKSTGKNSALRYSREMGTLKLSNIFDDILAKKAV